MLLDASRAALASGDAAAAVALAEELLDEEPDDVDALRIVADAAPRYGHAEVGLLAARQARARGADISALEAAALLAACQVEEALVAADALIAQRPPARTTARALAVRAQALELLGQNDASDAAYAQAHALSPEAYPRPLQVTADAWDTLLLAALSTLPETARDTLRSVELDFADVPDLAELRSRVPPPVPTSDALFHEPPEHDRAAEGSAPAADQPIRVTLYRRNLARGASTLDDLTRRIAGALEEELAVLDAYRESAP